MTARTFDASPRAVGAMALWMLCATSQAHHSKNVTYDTEQTIEVAGEVTAILWRNPHVRITLRSAGDDSQWDIEGNSVSILQRMGVTPATLAVGDVIRVAGLPARRGNAALFATNLLTSGDAELLLEPGAAPRWASEVIGDDAAWTRERNERSDAPDRPNGIFGVWSTTLTNPASFPLFPERDTNYPLTDTAREHVRAWQNVEDNPYFTCTPMGMPRVMGQPYPIEFVDRGTSIELHIELHDLVRVIALQDTPAHGERTPLGHSVGVWDGPTLVVTTTSISWPYFNQSGVPQSAQSIVTERFTPDADTARLHYELTVEDPETFTRPVTLRKYWHWRSGEQVLPFDCAD